MKEYKAIDVDSARDLLIKSCEQEVKENSNNFWANYSLIGKSLLQQRKDLITKLRGCSSVPELVCTLGENAPDTLKNLIVLKVYQTSEAEIDKQVLINRNSALQTGVGRHGSGSALPNRETVKNEYFQNYLTNARSNNIMVELH